MFISCIMSVMQLYYGLSIVRYFLFFICPFMLKTLKIFTLPIFATTAFVETTIKSSNLFLKKLNFK